MGEGKATDATRPVGVRPVSSDSALTAHIAKTNGPIQRTDPGRINPTTRHEWRALRASFSLIRTMTVGSGITPDLLSPPRP
ncbi:hypothetical protein GLI01_23080 [Gluconacetobacter liquefaciens]|nr:hypothetical protein GLI01_23080 [Gluconacetobacter liquefaciens]